MPDPTIIYGDLEDLLRSLGFEMKLSSRGAHFFTHPNSSASLFLPAVARDADVHPIHWTTARGTLDDFGFLPRAEFFDAVRQRRAVS